MTVTKWTLVRRPLGRHFVSSQCLDREVVSHGTVRIPFFFVKTSELHLILTKSVLGL
jgi:hypothetical protein